jgi:hypothetical protein
MKKNHFLFLLAFVCLAGKGLAQTIPCYTDEVRKKQIAAHPEILQYEAQLEKEIQAGLKKIDYKNAKRTTADDQSGNPNFWYDIPIVVHIIHNYGAEDLTDDDIYNALVDWNIVYAEKNSDTASVIPVYHKYIGNPHIRLHLATLDPYGNLTHGITRHRSYTTYIGGEQSKMDDWPSTSYINIWSINQMNTANGQAAAYAFQPPSAAGNPLGDGIISIYSYIPNSPYNSSQVGKTINHEMGHVFNLAHPWGNTNNPEVACGDDNVDDTPPTKGHLPQGCTNVALYDTVCARNYYKLYTSASGGDSLVNFPDTVNSQNIMDYTYCARMFTRGQVDRMHAALNSDVAGRNNLWDSINLAKTGALLPRPDLKPIPDFVAFPAGSSTPYVGNYFSMFGYFTFPGGNVRFVNKTWNDTVTSLTWTFSNDAAIPTQTTANPVPNSYINNSFSLPGWVDVKMTATGNHTGDSTIEWNKAVYVADAVATPGNIVEEFNGSETDHWPMFNYYNNEFQWKLNNSVGLYDNSCIEFVGYDSRIDPQHFLVPYTGTPLGDVDDLFSVPFDLSGFTDPKLYLNFYYSAASRSSMSPSINDELDIDYCVDKKTWVNLVKLTKKDLINKGALSTPYTPSSMNDWAPKAVALPAAARTNYTTFRFRYFPGIGADSTYSSGNNFYMDRLSFASWPASVANVEMGNIDVAVVPNPTQGDAWVVVKDAANATVKIVVSDITGKEVFTTSQQLNGNDAHILVPHSAISVPGMYMVEAITGSQVQTRKLVVY